MVRKAEAAREEQIKIEGRSGRIEKAKTAQKAQIPIIIL